MFELFFKYPATVFSKGKFVLLAGWPWWLLGIGILAVAVGLGWAVWKQRTVPEVRGGRSAVVWILQSLLVALLLLMLWQPALSVATLKPQQNIVAVVVDDSGSMATADEGGSTRKDRAASVLNGGLLQDLKDKFQVRLYRLSDHLERIDKLEQVTAQGTS